MLQRSWTDLDLWITGRWLDVPILEPQAGKLRASTTICTALKSRAPICTALMCLLRFDTRVDYVLSSPTFLQQWQLTSFQHIPNPASDHSFVIADFQQTWSAWVGYTHIGWIVSFKRYIAYHNFKMFRIYKTFPCSFNHRVDCLVKSYRIQFKVPVNTIMSKKFTDTVKS